ncbi:MAG TPA: M2 family metallopeptidase [Candidatus Eisenbacteria bacterium]
MSTIQASDQGRQAALTQLIGQVVGEIQPLQLHLNLEVWAANVTGDPAHEQESARLEAELRGVFARPEPFALLKSLQTAGGVTDPRLERQRRLLFNAFQVNQIPAETIQRIVRLEKKLESRFNTFRATLDGEAVTDNAIRKILRESGDVAARRRAWEASKQIGAEVGQDLLELVRLRNEAAQRLGYTDHYVMSLELKDEIQPAQLFAWLEQVDRGTRPLYDAYKRALDERLARRFGVKPAALRPWHYDDPFFQEAPAPEIDLDPWFAGKSLEEITRRFYDAVGFDIRDLLGRADLYEKPGKCQHAFCLSIDREADVRVLCNVRPDEYWMGTMLHEFGHAVYDQAIDRTLPFLLREPAHILTTEATAMLFGRLSKNAAWLTRYAGMPEAEARAAAEASRRATRDQLLVQTRWELVMCHMERALYRDPGQNLNRLWWDLVERFQGVPRPEGRSAPDWASKIHFCVAPVYYHNYLLGELMASQLQRFLQREVLGGGPDVWTRYVSSPEVGHMLRERLFRTGRALPWPETVRQATGETLSPSAFLAELAGRD